MIIDSVNKNKSAIRSPYPRVDGRGNPLVIRRVSAQRRFRVLPGGPGTVDVRLDDVAVTLYANSSLIRNLKGKYGFTVLDPAALTEV